MPSDYVGDDSNGWSCGISGNRVYVGSRRNPEQGFSSGAVYVFDYDGVSWNETVKLAAPDGLGGDELAWELYADGDAVIAGAYAADPAGSFSGAAYIWELPGEGCLYALPPTVTLGTGGTVDFFLAGGEAHAGELHVVLGTTTGTAPGILVDGFLLPLNFDAYTQLTLTDPTVISGGVGNLGTAGQGKASLTLPAGLNPALAGTTVHHAFALLDLGTFTVSQTSNAVGTVLGP